MNRDREQYINEQVNLDNISKSKNSAIAFLVVAIIFIFFYNPKNDYKIYITICSSAVIILSILRFLNVSRFNDEKLTMAEAVRNVSATAALNAILWCFIGIFSVLSFNTINIQVLTTFIVLIAFSASSVVTISHKKLVFVFISTVVLIPLFVFSILEFQRSHDLRSLWLIPLTSIYIIYNNIQSKVIQNVLRKNYANEYALKISIEEIAQSKKDLEEESIKTFHASRLSSLGEMAGGVAHEINNPLTIIQGMIKSILTHDSQFQNIDEATKSKLLKINNASDRIAKIVRGMKIFSSKNDKTEHEVISLSKILELSLDLFEDKLKNQNIIFDIINERKLDPLITCNPLQVSQIFVNLLSNAIDAMLKSQDKHSLTIKIAEDIENHIVDIRIINSGSLIPSELVPKIFEPFFSTKPSGEGTGLGLSISQTLAHSNNGFISYEVYEDKVCFKLQLSTKDKA